MNRNRTRCTTHPIALMPSRKSLAGRSCSLNCVNFDRTSGCWETWIGIGPGKCSLSEL